MTPPEVSLAAPHVTAVLLVSSPGAALGATLGALRASIRPVDRLLVLDASDDPRTQAQVEAHPIGSTLPGMALRRVAVGTDLRTALFEAVADGATDAVWVLTADAAPAPEALGRLLGSLTMSASAGIAGPKLVDWFDERRLVGLGLQTTRTGRYVPRPALGELDQGQDDTRTDVLAVAAVGMLVSADVLTELGGWTPGLAGIAADLDLGWRAQLAGHRVIVVPSAVVRTGALGTTGVAERDDTPDDLATLSDVRATPTVRRRVRAVALARSPWYLLPFLVAWVLVSRGGAALGHLLAKRPGRARDAAAEAGAVVPSLALLASRWSGRSPRRVASRHLRGLFATGGQRWRGRQLLLDEVDLAGVPDRSSRTDLDQDDRSGSAARIRTRSGSAQGPATVAGARAHEVVGPAWLWVVALATALAVTTSVAAVAVADLGTSWFDTWVGGELVGTSASAPALWQAATSAWSGPGFGHAGSAGPDSAVLAGWTALISALTPAGSVGVGPAMSLLLLMALPAAAAGMYAGAGALTGNRWLRLVAALVWSCSPVALQALVQGRVGAVAVLVLLPLAAAGIGRTLAPAPESIRPAWVSVTVALVAVLTALAPALGALALATWVGAALFLRRARWVSGSALVAVVAMLSPWWPWAADEPRRLLVGPGLTTWGPTDAGLRAALLGDPAGVGTGAAAEVLAWALLPVALIAAAAAFRRTIGHLAVVAVLAVGLLGVIVALVGPSVPLATVPEGYPDAGAAVTLWSGVGAIITTGAMLVAAVLALRGLRWGRWSPTWPATIRGALAVLVLSAVAMTVTGALLARTEGPTLRAARDPRPPLAIEQSTSALANRTLVLATGPTGVSARVLAADAADPVRALPADPAIPGEVLAAASQLAGSDRVLDGASAAATLARAAVAFVVLEPGFGDDLLGGLDTVDGLSRMPDHDEDAVWRVRSLEEGGESTVAPARVSVATVDGAVAASAGVLGNAEATLGVAGPAVVAVAQPAHWAQHVEVTADGRTLPVSGTPDGMLAYDTPTAVNRLRIDVDGPWPMWWAPPLLALFALVHAALPFGRGPARTGSPR